MGRIAARIGRSRGGEGTPGRGLVAVGVRELRPFASVEDQTIGDSTTSDVTVRGSGKGFKFKGGSLS